MNPSNTMRALAVASLMLSAVPVASAAFTVNGRQILRDGQPFQIRGVCYQPTPIGENPSTSPPYGDYFTPGYSALIARDLPLIRQLGANVVRIYGWDTTASHTAFLDACYNGGVDPVFVLVNRWIDPATNWSSTAAVDAVRQQFLQIDAGLGAHPAVLGIILGNETNAQNGNGANAAFWSAINSVAASVKQRTPSRLVSMAITDAIPQIAARNSAMTALDFWCVQTYRGTTLGTLFTEYAAASSRPLVLTEFGIDAFNATAGQPYPNNAEFVGTTVAGLWKEIAANAASCAGGCVFEFGDEWWKSPGSPSAHDAGGVSLPGLPDGFGNEEWWGLYAVADNGSLPDTLTPRATVASLRAAWAPPAAPETPASSVGAGGLSLSWPAVTGATSYVLERAYGAGGVFEVAADGLSTPEFLMRAFLAGATHRFRVRAVGAGGTSGPSGAVSFDPPAAKPVGNRLTNLSTRGFVGTGESILIPGFVFASDAPKQFLIRGLGPGLAPFLSGYIADPRITLFRQGSGAVVETNDNWSSAANAAQIASVGDSLFALALSPGSLDAAMLVTLDPWPSGYTIHVTGSDGGTGVALAEVYEVDGTLPARRLSNISTRGFVATGSGVMIPGFVVTGSAFTTLLLRAVGPGLAGFGIQSPLADPVLGLHQQSDGRLLITNDNWSSMPNANLVPAAVAGTGAFTLADGSRDATLLVVVAPGIYTAIASGLGGTSGLALVEVYEVP